MKKVKLFFTAVMVLLVSVMADAQNRAISGVVTDSSTGDPIVGAAVQLKGSSTTYTLTDALGDYSISVPSNSSLVVSCLGFLTQEVQIGTMTSVNVQLTPETEVLEDVIVVAYGTTRREAKTGSVTSLASETIAEVPVSSVDKMLAGKMAGVQITATSGQPGSNSNIRIRGTSSVNAGNEPLWVVDGIPVMSGDQSYFTNTNNAIAAINPSDIESITVLKDAAAASIYGSRAANGVILVTTKSGKSGKAKFSARAKYGVSTLANDNHFGVMTGEQLLGYRRDAAINAGFNPDDPSSKYYYPMSMLDQPLTNWIDELFRIGTLQEYEINASAGNDKGKYYTSLSYQNNNGVSYATSYKRLTARVNSDYKLTNSLDLGTRVNLAYTENHDTEMQSLYYSNPFFAGLIISPFTPLYDENGQYNMNIPENSNTNPLWNALCHGEDQWEKQYKVQGSVYLQWTPVKNLVFKTNDMFEGTFGQGLRYWGPDPGDTEGTLQASRSQYIQLTSSNTATYTLPVGEHNFRFLAGQEAQRYNYTDMFGYAPGVDPNIPYFTTSTDSSSEIDDSFTEKTLLSFFGNLDYNYAGKYFAAASIREDGSSLFGSKNKWGLFWSASASWNISSEDWMGGTSGWLDLLKLRLSYGVNGNNNVSAYRAYGVYAATAYNGSTYMRPSSPSNDELSWERNKTWNVGIDYAFLNNRISGQVDVYSRVTTDMLLNKAVPQTSGFGTNFMNIGSLSNKGLEFQIEGEIVRSRDFTWTTGFNIAFNRSKILDLGGDEWLSSSDSRLRYVKGKSFYTFYLKDYYGVDPTNGQALWRASDPADPDNEDAYVLTNDYNKARYVYAGSPEPLSTGGFNTELNWKGLALSAFFEFKTGNKVVINERRYLASDGNQMGMNQSIDALNYWKKPGDSACNPKPVAGNSSNSYTYSTRWMQNGDYLRVKDITLSYTFPKSIIEKANISNLKIYASALNAYTLHDVTFWDPERGAAGMGSGIYPQTKTFAAGVEISF